MNKITAVLEVVTSKRDMYGNRYRFLVITNTLNGKTGKASIDSMGNEDHVLRELGFDWQNRLKTEKELPIREFNRLNKYLSCEYVKVICEVLGKSYPAYVKRKEKQEKKRQEALEAYIKNLDKKIK